jgi:CRISPR/Cas system CSM-associated protein Csm2 small subunit
MGRTTIYTPSQIKKMKEAIRTGNRVTTLANEIANELNMSASQVRSKMYQVAKRTYKIKKNKPQKAVTTTPKAPVQEAAPTKVKHVEFGKLIDFAGKKITVHEDHIRLYF